MTWGRPAALGGCCNIFVCPLMPVSFPPGPSTVLLRAKKHSRITEQIINIMVHVCKHQRTDVTMCLNRLRQPEVPKFITSDWAANKRCRGRNFGQDWVLRSSTRERKKEVLVADLINTGTMSKRPNRKKRNRKHLKVSHSYTCTSGLEHTGYSRMGAHLHCLALVSVWALCMGNN